MFQDAIKAAFEYKLNPTDLSDQIIDELELADKEALELSTATLNLSSDVKSTPGASSDAESSTQSSECLITWYHFL